MISTLNFYLETFASFVTKLVAPISLHQNYLKDTASEMVEFITH